MNGTLQRIYITGAGIVSAIGLDIGTTLQSLLQERSGIAPLRYLQTSHHEFPVGEVPLSNEEMKQRLHIAEERPTTRTALLGTMALHEAVKNARLSQEQLAKAALVSGTTVGGMDKSELYYLDYIHNDTRNAYIKTHDCGACTEMIADHEGAFAAVTTLSTACSSAANAIMLGAGMINAGEYECVIVGGAECITKFHLNGFNSLRILDGGWCKPFDDRRAGLNLGEGAAFLVLESQRHAESRCCTPLAILSGCGNACDAYHQTASSPDGEGAYMAMSKALQNAGLVPSDIDYINAHGTGTPNNDASESAAIRRLFDDGIPPVSSSKSFTGHTTSAAGAIDAVIALLSLQNDFVPANLNWQNGESGECISPTAHTQHSTSLTHVMCNAFGFGGNDTSFIISHVDKEEAGTVLHQDVLNHDVAANWYIRQELRVKVLSATQISIQQPLCEAWMTNPIQYQKDYVRSIDPDFKPYVSSMDARRMGRVLKRAVATSKVAMQQANVANPDAIVIGTGLGCIESTELFLTALCTEGEEMLKPTHFMQSTHNTISSVVAIQDDNHGYNATYSHKSISFDSALYDACLQMKSGTIQNALVGGHDEMTPSYFNFLKKVKFLGQGQSVAGESASSMILASEGEGLCVLSGVKLLYCPTPIQLAYAMTAMLQAAGISAEDLNGVMTNANGDWAGDRACLEEAHALLPGVPLLRYKHLFGEGYTMSGLALYAAAHCLAKHQLPLHLYVNAMQSKEEEPHALLLLNRGDGKDYSIMLLTDK